MSRMPIWGACLFAAASLPVVAQVSGDQQPRSSTQVVVYGTLDAGLDITKGVAGRVVALNSGLQENSRLGFRGVEDLGDGMAATFQLEAGISVDSGLTNARVFNRASTVGLRGSMGEVRLGRFNSPHVQAINRYDPANLGTYATAAALTPLVNRINNSIRYDTPNWAGIYGSAVISFGEQAGSNSVRGARGLRVGLSRGGFNADAVAVNYRFATNSTARFSMLGASYDFGRLVLTGAVNTLRNGPVAIPTATNAANTADLDLQISSSINNYVMPAGADQRTWWLGARVPLTPLTGLVLTYGEVADQRPIAKPLNANMVGVAVVTLLSKRTSLHMSYGLVKNENGAQYAASTANTRALVDASGRSRGFSSGVTHNF